VDVLRKKGPLLWVNGRRPLARCGCRHEARWRIAPKDCAYAATLVDGCAA